MLQTEFNNFQNKYNMEFYLELSNRINTFRLQKDKSWREISDKKVLASDFTTLKVSEIIKLQVIDYTITLAGKEWKINQSSSTKLGDRDKLYYDVYVIRNYYPKLPSKEQLISVIKQGDDRTHNSLILNTYGFYELRHLHSLVFSIKDPTIVYRNETWSAGNEYVGDKASKNIPFIDEVYENSLEHWLTHLQNGLTNMYSDLRPTKSLDEILNELKIVENKFEKIKI